MLLIAWTAVYLVSVRRAVEFIPLRSHSFGAGWEGLLFNGVLGTGVAYFIWFNIIGRLTTVMASLGSLINPVVGSAFATVT